jgi:hypothetical protein
MDNNGAEALAEIRTTGKMEKASEEILKNALNEVLKEFVTE